MKPWEKYQAPTDQSDAPWKKYKGVAEEKKETRASDYFPGLYTDEKGLTVKAKKGGLLDPSPSKLADAAADVGDKIERYARAPLRKGIDEYSKGRGIIGSVQSAISQVGRDTEGVPSGRDFAERLGVTDETPLSERIPWAFTDKEGLTLQAKKGGLLDVSPRGLVGGVIEEGLDPTLALSSGKILAKTGRAVLPTNALKNAEKAKYAFGRAHLRPTPITAERLGEEAIRDAVDESLNTGAMRFGGKAKDTYANLKTVDKEVGAVIGDIVDGSPNTVSPQMVADRVRREVIDPLKKTAEGSKIAKDIEGRVDGLLAQYSGGNPDAVMSAKQLEAEKRAVHDSLNFDRSAPKGPKRAVEGYASSLREAGEELVDHPSFVPAKKSLGNIKNAKKMAGRTARLTSGGLMGKITDTGTATAAAQWAISNPVAAASLLATRLITKGRVASSGAVTADTILKAAEKAPGVLKDLGMTMKEVSDVLGTPEAQRAIGRGFRGTVTGAETERRQEQGLLR